MGLFENMNAEQVRRLSLRKTVFAKAEDKVRDVVLAMRNVGVGCAILVDEDRKPVGMFTENMLTQIVAHKPEVMDQAVGQHVAEQWPQVRLSDPIIAVLEALEFKNVRFLSVVDESGAIVGLTGQKGLMEYIADHFPQVTVQRVGQSQSMKTREGA